MEPEQGRRPEEGLGPRPGWPPVVQMRQRRVQPRSGRVPQARQRRVQPRSGRALRAMQVRVRVRVPAPPWWVPQLPQPVRGLALSVVSERQLELPPVLVVPLVAPLVVVAAVAGLPAVAAAERMDP